MKTTICRLPNRVFEVDLLDYVRMLSEHDDSEEIIINLADCDHYTPGAILFLIGKALLWDSKGINIKIEGAKYHFFQYLQRMNFFSFLSFDLEENFKRHNHDGKFIPIIEFGPNSRNDQEIDKDPDRLTEAIVDLTLPPARRNRDISQIKNGLLYSYSELIMNVVQHSNGTGYVFAQYNNYKDYVRIAILDRGIGIRGSFVAMNSPHLHEGMTDAQAIQKALEPEVSSKPIKGPGAENAGLGLTLLKRISDIAGIDMAIISNNGFVNKDSVFNHTSRLLNGTLCTLTLKRSALEDFDSLFKNIREF